MAEQFTITKPERKKLVAIIKRGILRHCEEWLDETCKIISKEYDGEENAFDRCMEITLRSKKFYKEAMRREDYYRNSQLIIGASKLLAEGYLTEEDIVECDDEVRNRILFLSDLNTCDLDEQE